MLERAPAIAMDRVNVGGSQSGQQSGDISRGSSTGNNKWSIDGVDVYMYFRDHAPPHVHAFYGDDEVLVVIRDGSVYIGSIQANKLALVRDYVAANVEELLARWATCGGG